jgi:hypothetical protein
MFHSSTPNCRPHTPERMIPSPVRSRTTDAERRKIERNLHDGAQQQLIAVTIPAAPSRSAHGPETEPP